LHTTCATATASLVPTAATTATAGYNKVLDFVS
jgi:hypothetical protein